ncbi:MAG: hypothetical protein ABJC51_06870 [Acidobacteriota bacterium]
MTGLTRSQGFGGALTVMALAAIVGGLLLLGPPPEERARQFDQRRIDALETIESAVQAFRTQHERLPASLEELRQQPGRMIRPNDPRTGQPYEYRLLDAASYELCAQFDRQSSRPGTAAPDQAWAHDAGRQCFRRKAR